MPEEKKRDPVLLTIASGILACLGWIALETHKQGNTISETSTKAKLLEKYLPKNLETLQKRMLHFETAVATLAQRVENVDERLVRVAKRQDALEERVRKMEESK